MAEKLSRRQKAHQKAIQKVKEETINSSAIDDFLFKSITLGSPTDFQRFIEGIQNNVHLLYDIAKKVSIVDSCIQIIGDEISQSELTLNKKVQANKLTPFKTSKTYNHALSRPNSKDTQVSFLKKLATGFLIEGRVAIIKTVSKGVTEFTPYWFRYITRSMDDQGNYTYLITYRGMSLNVPPENILVIESPGYDDNGNCPHSRLRSVITEVTGYSQVLTHINNHLKNGMIAKGFLEQTPDSKLNYSMEQLSELSRQFNNKTSGIKSSDTISMPKGITYKPVQVSLAEEGLFEFFQENQDAILRAFRVPRSFFDNQSDSYATAEVQRSQFYKNTILPIFRIIEDALNNWDALTGSNEYFQFDRSNIQTSEEKKNEGLADKAKADAALTLSQTKSASIAEVRQVAGLKPLLDDAGNPVDGTEDIPALNPDLSLLDPSADPNSQNNQSNNQDTQKVASFYRKLIEDIADGK